MSRAESGAPRAQPGAGQPLGRIQVTRATTGGDVYELLLSGKT